jgi:hypothetical protein
LRIKRIKTATIGTETIKSAITKIVEAGGVKSIKKLDD